ncbi:MAG: hypothetical protein GC178_15190 [Flavobacteriales bacterium]|nr:hypothetical protein [Flavobacteriales bacterium]
MNLSQTTDSTDLFLRECYSETRGWACSDDFRIGRFLIDCRFEHLDGRVKLIQRVHAPLVDRMGLKEARNILASYLLLHPQDDVELILVYRELLIPPSDLPAGVMVISLTEEQEQVPGYGLVSLPN